VKPLDRAVAVPLLSLSPTATVPAACAGVVQVIVLESTKVTFVAATPSKVTLYPNFQNPEPVIVTFVPPAGRPELGETPVTAPPVEEILIGGAVAVGAAVGFSTTCGRAVGIGAAVASVVVDGAVRAVGAGATVGAAAAGAIGFAVAIRGCTAGGGTGVVAGRVAGVGPDAARATVGVPILARIISVARRSAARPPRAP
jgi:hypothetical protein